ncbi:MAG: hypothetical protein ACK5NI_00930 [bacterium]
MHGSAGLANVFAAAAASPAVLSSAWRWGRDAWACSRRERCSGVLLSY